MLKGLNKMNAQKSLLNLGRNLIFAGLIMTIIQFIFELSILMSSMTSENSGGEGTSRLPMRGITAGAAETNVEVNTTYIGFLIIFIGVILLIVVYVSEQPWKRDQKGITVKNGDIEVVASGVDNMEKVIDVFKEISEITPKAIKKNIPENQNDS